jgi:regulator of PEP synthase PpsR (kinase-PPPase family)
MSDRTVFFISDGTGITAETMGNSILAQFAIKPRHIRRPFIDSVDKAYQVVREINATGVREGKRPIVFITMANDDVMPILKTCEGKVFDVIQTFVIPLEEEFNMKSNHRVGRFSDPSQDRGYNDRIEAINFALEHDDGQSARSLDTADVVLVGVSRCGKTDRKSVV